MNVYFMLKKKKKKKKVSFFLDVKVSGSYFCMWPTDSWKFLGSFKIAIL